MPFDKIEKLGNSVIQHGKYNSRVYLMKLDVRETDRVIQAIGSLAGEKKYDRIIAKIPKAVESQFQSAGFTTQAEIPAFYLGLKPMVFMAKNLNPDREIDTDQRQRERVLNTSLEASEEWLAGYKSNYTLREAHADKAEEIAQLYAKVFDTYPFPIIDPDYIKETMRSNVRYFTYVSGNNIIAVASSEMDRSAKNVEMTDFATGPEYRKGGLASSLLFSMERVMIVEGFLTAYTICRAVSYGMNLVFAKNGYHYGGTLINNTNISGQIESMNIWYKPLINLK